MASVFGFNRARAGRLRKIADREGLSSGRSGGLIYPEDGGFQPGIPFLNSSGETAPAYAIMRVTASTAETSTTPFYLTIGKPNTDFKGLYLVNGPDAISNGGTGIGYLHMNDAPGQYAAYNTAATPAFGESWGAVSASWLLHQHGPGFWILGGHDGTKVNIIQQIPAEILVKSTGTRAAGSGPHSYDVYGGAAGAETASGQTVSAYNRMDVAFNNAKFGAVGFMNGQGYAVKFQT